MKHLHAAIQRLLNGETSFHSEVRVAFHSGEFGAVAPYFCEGHCSRNGHVTPCGPVWEEPESVCTYKGCGFDNYSGPEPDEYESVCPNCGGYDVFEWEDHNMSFKSKRRVRELQP